VTDIDEAEFWVRREDQHDVVVVRAGGELDTVTAEELAQRLKEAEDAVTSPGPVLLDLTDVTYLSSAGIATLVIHTRRCAELNSRLCVVADQPAVLRPITLSGADKAIEIAPTIEEAIGAG
jgi:anti-anti-sigma factor